MSQFLKLKLEGEEGVSKIKYNGEDFEQVKTAIAQKLKINQAFDLLYTEGSDQVIISDEDDWRIYLDSAPTDQTGPVNLTIIIRLKGGQRQSHSGMQMENPNSHIVTSQVLTPQPEILLGQTLPQMPPSPDHQLQSQKPVEHGVKMTYQNVDHPPATKTMDGYAPMDSALFAGAGTSQLAKSAVHSNITCDECKVTPVVGRRYKSVIIDDFDLCETCHDLPNYSTHTFILIPYSSNEENANIYGPQPFKAVLNIFRGKVKDPADAKIDEIVSKMMQVFLSANRNEVKTFVKSRPGMSYDNLYHEYIRKYHMN